MRRLDPRLLRWARATRAYLVFSVAVGALTAVAIIGQAVLLATIITAVFQQDADLSQIGRQVLYLAAVVAVRSALAYLQDWAAFHSAARAKSQLRMAVLEHAVALGPGYIDTEQPGRIAQLTGRGIDALDAYFARYLPQLVLAVIVPITVIVVVVTQDLLAAVIVALTLPLIPVFMVLVGWYTRSQVDRQWRTLAFLSGHFLDVVAGLPTLKIFGRARAQAQTIRMVGDRYRRATMRVLRVSFLSSLVLELLATLSVAIVAVSIGLRLVNGSMDLYTGLLVLILAPEAYLPVRMVGAQFHAAAEGIEASASLLDVLSEPVPQRGSRARPEGPLQIELSGVTAEYPGRPVPALRDFTMTVAPAAITALAGPSGAGKSTVLQLLLGFRRPVVGEVVVRNADAAEGLSAAPGAVPGSGGAGAGAAEADGRSGAGVGATGADGRSGAGVGAAGARAGTGGRSGVDSGGVESAAEGRNALGTLPLGEIDSRQWLDGIAWLPQEPVMVAGTVADNIRLGREAATAAEVGAAAAAAGLSEPGLLDQPVAETGAGVSAGQRRRVGLARVLLRDAPLVLLDEPSAALDPSTEEAVVAALEGLRREGRTVVVVAHRPALLEMADHVVHMAAPIDTRVPEAAPAGDPSPTAGPGSAPPDVFDRDATPAATSTAPRPPLPGIGP